ncbi:extracellular solute-binding protein [Paenibacillus sp. HB172176]|uniref:ABC transporter substrate-binding protein n=1 Tax=Paenibacillus sp. HB172176 TaxID=2493690 RepID=UPI001438D1D5|nr:extracellular solute-binding protein [Paenibacillus sp. HB172176]
MKRSAFAKKLLYPVLAGVLAFSLAGCGKSTNEGEPGDSETTASPEQAVKTVRLVLTNDTTGEEAFYQDEMKKFMEQNPNVKVELIFNPGDQMNNAIQLMFASGDSPDVFRIQKVGLENAYSRELIQPIDSYLTDEFVSRFPEGTFSKTGTMAVGGSVFSIPVTTQKWGGMRVLYYNSEVLKQYGYDKPPQTLGEYKEMSAHITKEGKGQVYGTSIAGKGDGLLLTFVNPLARAAGSGVRGMEMTAGHMSVVEGEWNTADPAIVSTVNYLRDMNQEKIFPPGWETWDSKQLYQMFSAGKVAMFIGMPYEADEINKLNDQLQIGITEPPIPDTGRKGYQTQVGDPAYFVMSSNTKNPDAAWTLMNFLGSEEFEHDFFAALGAAVVMPGAYEGVEMSSEKRTLLDLSEQIMKLGPNPEAKNPDMKKITSDVVAAAPKPRMEELVLNAIINNLDYKEIAEEYDKKMNQLFDDKIEEYRKNGSAVTKDDYKVSDWDQMKDYIAQ